MAPAEGVPPPADASVPVGVVPIGVAPVPVGVVPVGVVPVPVGAEPPPADAAVPIGGVPPPVPAVPPAEPPAAADSPREPADFPYTELTREDRKALLYALCGDEGKFFYQLPYCAK